MAHLPDAPSDIALNYYKYQTYAKLEDVLGARNPDEAGVARHDSHHFPEREAYSIEVLQVETPSSSNEEDENDAFEMKFRRSGLGRQLDASENGSETGGEHPDSPELAPNDRLRSHGISGRPASLVTAAVAKAIDDMSASESSDVDLSDINDQRRTRTMFRRKESYPEIPPEPYLQPVQRNENFPEDPSTLHLDNPNTELPFKHHMRARTFPLRMRPIPSHGSDAHPQSHSQEQSKVLIPPPDTLRSGAPTLQVPQQHLARPLHMQPHPGRARPLPPTHPRPHFAPNPAPIAVPLPRRPSNPPPPVSPATDTFYRELKSKLWKLAQELEARGDANRVSFKEDEIPSPDTPIDDVWDKDDDVPWDDEVVVNEEEHENAIDEESFHGIGVESLVDALKRRGSGIGIGRRMSEGRGRRAARERAERARAAWLRGPD
ncbi:hypothetical protein BCR34DRAFT_48060 [Clohesyomyces aquaticus]|uniref:Uncharacterized protein n=1 Tax=Clohesyomyces aquaticus TaxID=1231657 RepID=A0A1Y1Z5N3_9PLEO|nr:hypothetical protein BCR34DRAFT_48060 [Clohesyomyces aquaticus]